MYKKDKQSSDADVTATMKMFSAFLLEKKTESSSEFDEDSVVDNDPLAVVDIKSTEFNSNIMLIKVPEDLRSSSDPYYQLATVDRSIPGNTDLKGNAVLDKLYPNLPKVTPFEEPKPQEDDITPPRKQVPSQERPKPARANRSNARRSMRRSYPVVEKNYRKPAHETSNWKPRREINPWIPGAEPFENLPKDPIRAKSGSRNLAEYPNVRMPANAVYVPSRENLLYKGPVRSDSPLQNFSAGYDDIIQPGYSGNFDDGPQPCYSKDFVSVLPPVYPEDFDSVLPPVYSDGYSDGPPRTRYSASLLMTPQSNYNKPTRRRFQSRMNGRGNLPMNSLYTEGPRDPGMNYRNLNSRGDGRYQSNKRFSSNSYPKRGHHNAQSGTFQSPGGENYIENRPRGTRQKRFRRRGRQNF